jgi:hypothetical protein
MERAFREIKNSLEIVAMYNWIERTSTRPHLRVRTGLPIRARASGPVPAVSGYRDAARSRHSGGGARI